ncbi:hypothetical protein ST47_g641 [Ascochyta rabiei]|uniref:Uncharacterized protein n=2 Tax=Didymella rabiei TaxID=5454 RepID=A0A163LY64_DIDRA|nr:hypothetical protein ST47_g641 [Ascochyta rabiei]
MPPNHNPPFPGYCAPFPVNISNLVMAIIGAAYPFKSAEDGTGVSMLESFVNSSPGASRPSFWETTSVADRRYYYNIAIITYWPSALAFDCWKAESEFGNWWKNADRKSDGHG